MSRPNRVAPKSVVLTEYRTRLRDNIKSLTDNFREIIHLANIESEPSKQIPRVVSYASEQYEMEVRAANMARSVEGIRRLIGDLRQFLVLNDFAFVNEAITASNDDAARAKAAADSLLRQRRDQISHCLQEFEADELSALHLFPQ